MNKRLSARRFFTWGMIILGLALAGCGKKIVKPGTGGGGTAAAGVEEVPKAELEIKGKSFIAEPNMGNVYFEFDQYTITPATREVLIKNAEWIQANPDKEILIAGHCDERGTVEYNLALGDKRAKTVRDYYYRAGISYERMATISYGREKPLDPGQNEEAWAKNRRAETLIKK